ncbi:hypothetical protein BDP27DRAFT_1432435 [Rhodocollybia butyracea]|uniref:Uncharacterized protein n=1 Tax=Rhodocollybia butyracea TaxID=206335 RepID=A0A9P5P8V3_9AGAR|nr:hypothetical protein BDP27DRAFT_1432435 [Rhodocollybia butyracea]
MAPIRAYYLPADSASATDTSRPVSVEKLDALGWKTTFIGSSGDELEKAARNQVQELGYPVTHEGCAVGVDLESFEKNAATLTPEMVALLTKILHSESSDICTTKDSVAVVTSGSPYVHVEDVITKAWIQLDIVPGTFIHFPAGAKFRLTFNENNRKAAAIVFSK